MSVGETWLNTDDEEEGLESASDPVVSAGRLGVQQRLPRSLDGHRFVSDAAVAALRAMSVSPIPGDKGQVRDYYQWEKIILVI